MKNVTKIIVSAVNAVAVVGAALGVHFGYAKTTDETKTYTVETEDDTLRVAVISDLQMPNSDDKTSHQYESYKNTLTMLKNKGMDVLLIGGDFTDLGTRTAWEHCKEIYDEVMADSEKPIPLYIMGNHDYWLDYFAKSGEIPTPAKMQKRFTKYTGEYPYSHKIINGYHFICWSSSDGSYDKSYQNKEWIRAQLDEAVADDPDKPIFVITHLNPSNTAYGSDEWGNDDIYDVLKDYSQAISISGHSHYSLLDERSIWQGDFTAFTTQSLDYIELESGKFNGSIPVDAYGNSIADDVPMCLYMEIANNKVTVERLNSATGEEMKEPWVIEAPFGTPSKYTDNRKNENKAPVLDEKLTVNISDIKDVNDKSQKMISFKAGTDDDFVHSYKLQFLDENRRALEFDETDYDGTVIKYDSENNKVSSDSDDYASASTKKINELLYFSDFVVGLDKMSDSAELRLPSTVPENAKYVAVTAIDSWGAESNTVICEM
ncbi:MAG: metallophosphoesterase family protein [Eubacterium sp.]